ncbi:MAG: hypothetical protein HC945_02480 [Nitrosarchaeum sp.]|nr:hypothetical protein [Nitrosarchaeum sp.]
MSRWISRHQPLEPEDLIADNAVQAEGSSVEVIHHDNCMAVRYIHDDAKDSQFQWQTDLTFDFGSKATGVEIELHNGWKSRVIAPTRQALTRPVIVPELMDAFGASIEGLRIFPNSIPLFEEHVSQFKEVLFAPERRFPLVYVTRDNCRNKTAVSPQQLASRLAGLAYVVEEADKNVSFALSKQVGRLYNTYNGAVRVYWPIAADDVPSNHPFWIKEHISPHLLKHIFKMISEQALASPPRNSYAAVRRRKNTEAAMSRNDIRAIVEEADLRVLEIEEYYQSQIKELSGEVARLRWQLSQTGHSQAEAQDSPTPPHLFRTIREAVAFFQKTYRGEHVYLAHKILNTNNAFREPQTVFSALEWLHDVFYESKRNGCHPDLGKSALERTGMDYMANQKESTMKRYAEDYSIEYNGRKIWLPCHLRKGNNRREEETLRIGFTWDGPTQKVVVGYLGQHQRNTLT